MKVHDIKKGRLGNAVFRYFASTLFCILYDFERTENMNECQLIMTDERFVEWSLLILQNITPKIKVANYLFDGFYQHDNIFVKYKERIVNWIIAHPNELLWTDGNNEINCNFHYDSVCYNNIDLIVNPYKNKYYDVVLHIRLEDFVENSHIIHPLSIVQVLNQINKTNICIVTNKLKTDFEEKYIAFLNRFYDFVIESNDIIEDLHIMKNSKILICSLSTISWIAGFLSETIETVYFPNYKEKRIHETCKKPHKNTILYDFVICSKNEVETLFCNF